MAALGHVDPLDGIITTDTEWETQETYQSRQLYTDWLEKRGIPVHVVQTRNIHTHGGDRHRHIPFWIAHKKHLPRECTQKYKIRPRRRKLREILGYHATNPPSPPPLTTELWLGISLDEHTRTKGNTVKYAIHRWPLIEMKMTRQNCIDYLTKHRLPVPPKSGCVCCPFNTPARWRKIRESADWQKVVAFDEAHRNGPLAQDLEAPLYLWRGLQPLRSTDFNIKSR